MAEEKKTELSEEQIKKLNIYEKLSLITDEIGVIAKDLKVQVNKNASYNAVSERNVLDAVKPIENKYRVYSYPSEREVIDKEVLVKETEYQGTINRTNTLFMRIDTVYRFVNLDNPEEYIETVVYGDGIDTGDKAPGKAMTYADKYALMKMYKMSTGDDPDKEASPENGYGKKTTVEKKATEGQVAFLNKLNIDIQDKIFEKYNVSLMEDLTLQQASEIISKMKGQK